MPDTILEEFSDLINTTEQTAESESDSQEKETEPKNENEQTTDDKSTETPNNDNEASNDNNEPDPLQEKIEEEMKKEENEDGENKSNDNKEESKEEKKPELFEDADKAITEFHDKLTPAKQEEFKQFIDTYNNTISEKYKTFDEQKSFVELVSPVFETIDKTMDGIEFVTGTDKDGNPVKTKWDDFTVDDVYERLEKNYKSLANKMKPDEGIDGKTKFSGDSFETFMTEMVETSLARGGGAWDIINQFASYFVPTYKTDSDGKVLVDENNVPLLDTDVGEAKKKEFDALMKRIDKNVAVAAEVREQNKQSNEQKQSNATAEAIQKFESDPQYGDWFKRINSKDERKSQLLAHAVRKIKESGNKMPIEEAFKKATKLMMVDMEIPQKVIDALDKKPEEKPKQIKKQTKPKSSSSDTPKKGDWDLDAEIDKLMNE